MIPRLSEHPLIKMLRELRLDPDDYVVCGSGPLLARGLRDTTDLDLVARKAAWDRAVKIGKPTTGSISGDAMYQLADVEIYVSDRWFPPLTDTDALIEKADHFEGIRFARVIDVLAYKAQLNREQDHRDIALLKGATATEPV